MRKFLTVLFLLLVVSIAHAEHVQSPVTELGGSVLLPQIKGIVAPTKRPPMVQELILVEKSIKSIEPPTSKLSPKYRRRIAKAFIRASRATGVDVVLLVAVARVESDFLRIYKLWPECTQPPANGLCHADCGITQHHLHGPKRWVIKRCKQLARSVEKASMLSAKELAAHVKWCQENKSNKRHTPLIRCILNRYNGGPFYNTKPVCTRRHIYRCAWKCPPRSDARLYKERAACVRRCYRKYRKCLYFAGYWRRVMCFDYGARNYLKPVRNCRKAWRIEDISTKFYPE